MLAKCKKSCSPFEEHAPCASARARRMHKGSVLESVDSAWELHAEGRVLAALLGCSTSGLVNYTVTLSMPCRQHLMPTVL